MLQHLRDNSRGVISFILIGFLVIIFALTGVEALFNWDTSANQAAKVNGEAVTEMDVARAINILGTVGSIQARCFRHHFRIASGDLYRNRFSFAGVIHPQAAFSAAP